MDPLESRRKRAALVGEMRALIEKAETEKRNLSGEEEGSYKKMEEDVRDLGVEIKREESLRGLETDLKETLNDPHTPSVGDDGEKGERKRATDEYRKLFWSCLQSRNPNPPEARDLFVAEGPKGGYLVPEAYETELIKALEDLNVMRTLATVRTSGTLAKIPVVTGRPVFHWIGEKGTYQETDTEFGQINIDAHKGGGIVKVSEELMDDSFINLEAELREQFALGQGDLEEAALVLGDGIEKPRGVVLDAETGVTTASATAITGDEVMDLKYSLRKPYRGRARWLMSDTTALAVMKLKNAVDGQYLWRPGLQAGQPDILLNSYVETSTFMEDIAASVSSILYGDFSYYRVQDRAGISIQKLLELYAENGQVGFRITFRTDGRLLLAEAVKAMVQKSS